MADRTIYPYACSAERPVLSFGDLVAEVRARKARGQRIVTTNGCFDLVHAGHIVFLGQARAQGDVLIVGLNSDESVARIKGPGRPLVPEAERALLLANLRAVDFVVVFADVLSANWLESVQPHLHCKGGDYNLDSLPAAEIEAVQRHGGEVRFLPLVEGISTSKLISRVAWTIQNGSQAAGGESVVEQLLAGSNMLRQTAYGLAGPVEEAAGRIADALAAGGRVLACGLGSSASLARHFAGELAASLRSDRADWPAIVLAGDGPACAAGLRATGRPGDVLLALAANTDVAPAVAAADELGIPAVVLTGTAAALPVERALVLAVPSQQEALIHQAHLALLHTLCGLVASALREGAEP
jgi:rfaE bifunctional protein nucleotidyltransferase chain/domain